MAQTKKVALYGGSLFLAGLGVSLSAIPELEIQQVEAKTKDDMEWVRTSEPDVIVAELEVASGTMALNLMKKFPRVTLIGLDPESDRLLIMSVKQQTALAANDLVKVIQASNPDSLTKFEGVNDE